MRAISARLTADVAANIVVDEVLEPQAVPRNGSAVDRHESQRLVRLSHKASLMQRAAVMRGTEQRHARNGAAAIARVERSAQCRRPRALLAADVERFSLASSASLDIFWLRDESLSDSDNLPEPGVIAAEIVADLEAALEQFRLIAEDLGDDDARIETVCRAQDYRASAPEIRVDA